MGSNESMGSRLALVMKSGKYVLGYKQTLKTLRNGKSKLVIIANNTPPLRKSEIEYYAMLAKLVSTTTPATTTSWELPAENTSGCARCQSPTPATATSSEPCLALSQKQQLESGCLKLLPIYCRCI